MTVKAKVREKSLSQALRDLAEENKGKSAGVDKRFTAMKTAASKDAGGTGSASSICEPTSEELAQINEFTRSPKQAHELVVFSTLSCNDLVDRDDEKFTTDTVKDFAKLAAPYGPTGKSYMVGHDYSKLPVGRIFDTSTDVIDGATFLKNKVYIPNTEANKSMIENIDFGVNWAVSVGVMLEASECGLSFCGAAMSRWGFCYEGHDKGFHYVKDGETDSWGYPLPVDPKVAGAEKCIGLMKGAKDFYELSQVFLGAQFYASLEKQPGFKGVIKAANASTVPLLGLSAKEARELPLPHLDDRAVHALRTFGASWDADGVLKWTDDQKLIWTYDPTEAEGVMCLGKDASSDTEEDDQEVDADGTAPEQPESEPLGSDEGEQSSSADEAEHDGEGDDPSDGDGDESGEEPEGVGSDGSVDDTEGDSDEEPEASADEDEQESDENNEEEKAVSKADVLKALRGLKAPNAVLAAVKGADGESLDAALSPLVGLVKAQGDELTVLRPKAALGDDYLAKQRAEAIDWYVRANSVEGKGVNTDQFQKMLDQCGDSLDLIKSLGEMQKQLAQAKFPGAVRRSSFPSDVNKAEAPAEVDVVRENRTGQTVSRLHG